MPRHTQVPGLEVAPTGNQGMESSDEPEAYQDQLDLHASQGSQDLPLQSVAIIERNQPVEELVAHLWPEKPLVENCTEVSSIGVLKVDESVTIGK